MQIEYRKVSCAALALAAACAAYWPLRLAWAEHCSRAAAPETVARAVRLAPGDADFRLRLANAREAAGADPIPALEAAAALDPGNAAVWMRLGLAAELHGDFATAGRCLLEAARVSRQFEPSWTLANYYCRRNDPAHFWPWVRAALDMAYGDFNPVFELCWNMSRDGGQILARAIPERRAILNPYLWYLLQKNRLDAAAPVAAKLAALATPDDQAALLAWCDRRLEAGAVAAALEVWNTMCARRLLPYPPLDAGGAPLTDPGFASAPLGGGFGWRRPALAGVASGRHPAPAYVWFSWNGKQPESCEPLAQLMPLAPGARYRLRFEYRTNDIPLESGLRWRVFDSRTNADLAAGSPWLSSPDWKRDEFSFAATADTMLARLALTYQRLPGATRIEGSLDLRRLSLERLP